MFFWPQCIQKLKSNEQTFEDFFFVVPLYAIKIRLNFFKKYF